MGHLSTAPTDQVSPSDQKVIETTEHSAALRYKRAVRMAFGMAALSRSKSGAYTARKSIPKDVQDEYERLFDHRWEAKLTLPAKLTPAQAKAQYGEWLTDVET